METWELVLMNPNFTNPAPRDTTIPVFISGQLAAQPGDMPFTLRTIIQDNLNFSWRLQVTVTWAGNNTGISESLIVTRQENFRF
jgi:hypothetical protein